MVVPLHTGDSSTAINPQLIRDWAQACAEGLETMRAEINALNVFPIPDSDTGSNMASTMAGAVAALDALTDQSDLPTVTRTLAEAAVSSARGNSGIILSQVLIGLADAADLAVAENDPSFNRLVKNGLRLGALAARRAVSEPRDGTILTILKVAADSASAHVDGSPADLSRAVADDCSEALELTPEQMPELASAGVVDAGARGFLVMADALVLVVTGVANKRRAYRGILTVGGGLTGHDDGECVDPGDTDFEVMYLLDATDGSKIGVLRDRLGELGDSIVIVGDNSAESERFSVHVHTNEPGSAVEAGIAVGVLSDIRISCFALDAIRSAPGANDPPPRYKRAVVALVTGDGAAELFTEAGATVVRADHGVHPATLTEAIRAADSAHVIVMGNGMMSSQDLVQVGAQARSSQRSVVFLPTLSMAQCLSALAVHEPDQESDVDAFAMAEAAAGTRWGSLVRSNTKMMTLAGTCEIGDTLGLIGSDVLVIAPEQRQAATALLDLMLATGGEMVTVLAGRDLDDDARAAIAAHVRAHYAGIELALYEAGQSKDLLQVGIE
ncbi:DAK2 domain-containing protein [Gordonia sp. (in: high G+C Gram-positive bacteria)]|uniref:DAK2 domain-containing protein n=1 Tax=Gordonia sp. (in: high G+C Gram-positive bacteria) TaxID=84139 RepID=UPI00169BE06E|nr:DAK2 domain-containing protein [Gordonia sp. (in: high G+C Gram-positive bacteria)]NLG46683.1 DAK2 domain-containing protein [Gordonia sp. (in: high G+C Gram-positive bacteria)]